MNPFRSALQIFRRSYSQSYFQDESVDSFPKEEKIYDRNALRSTSVRFFSALPILVTYALFRQPFARDLAKEKLAIASPKHDQVFNGRIFTRANLKRKTSVKHNQSPIIILPVYNAFDELTQCLERLKGNYNGQLILINDASTDEKVHERLKQFQKEFSQSCILIENTENIGRLQCFNIGLRRAREENRVAVLLHSDSSVPKDWLERIIAPIVADDHVASVTPFSNNAGIFSLPFPNHTTRLKSGALDRLDIVARTFLPAPTDLTVPYGSSFCMAINPRFLRHIPLFDESFGSGYCEDIDWCQKARALEGRNVMAADLFVEHVQAASFGAGMRAILIDRNQQVISGRYSNMKYELRDLAVNDPFASWRFALAMAYLNTLNKIQIHFASRLHNEVALEHYILSEMSEDEAIVIIWVGGEARWNLEIAAHGQRLALDFDEIHWVLRLLLPLTDAKLYYSSFKGSPDLEEDFGILKRLHTRHGSDLTVHMREDFFTPYQKDVKQSAQSANFSAEAENEWVTQWQEISSLAKTEFLVESGLIYNRAVKFFSAENVIEANKVTKNGQQFSA